MKDIPFPNLRSQEVVGLLGSDLCHLKEALELRKSPQVQTPLAKNCKLGWVAFGPIYSSGNQSFDGN